MCVPFSLNPAFCWKRTFCCFRMCQMELCFPPPPLFCWPWHHLLKPDGYPHWAHCKKKKCGGRANGCWTTVPILMVSPFSPMAPVFFSPFVHLWPSRLCLRSMFRRPVTSSRDRRWRDCGGWTLCSSLSLVERERERKKVCVNVCPYMFPSTATQASVCWSLLKKRLDVWCGWVI